MSYQVIGKRKLNGRLGDYIFNDQDGNFIGKIEGKTLAEPFYKFYSKITDRKNLLVPLTKNHYALKIDTIKLAIIKFEKVFSDKVMNIIFDENNYFRLENRSNIIIDSEILFEMFYPLDVKFNISIKKETGLSKITFFYRLLIEPFLCLIPIIFDRFKLYKFEVK